jgi:hypothetical protein
MELSYQKNDNSILLSSLVKNNDLINPQNYIPIYSNFFALSQTNYNSINLKQAYSLSNIIQKYDENTFQGKVKDQYGNTHTKDIFFKYSPLLDPIKYMIGKYNNDKYNNDKNDNSSNNIFNLPSFNNTDSNEKMIDTNNSAYIDSFFSYLTSKVLHTHGFLHGLDFYGSFLSIKNNFMVNVYDDTDYLSDSAFFKKNLGNLFTVNYDFHSKGHPSDTRNFKEPIKIIDETPKSCIQLSDIHDLDELDKILADSDNENNNTELSTIYEMNNNIVQNTSEGESESESDDDSNESNTDSDSDYSPSTSETDASASETDTDASETDASASEINTDTDTDTDMEKEKEKEKSETESECSSIKEKDNEEDGNDEEDNDEEEDDDDDDDDAIIATINKFPVQAIALEKCENTLDSLIVDDDHKLSDDEWESIVIQVLMCLIVYQKMFNFTHNDLHSNNIMYIKTDIKHLYYHVNKKYYKVPTFGRIFKIIDFGRAIYTFRKTVLCSDSFSKNGDASSQYNCEPYFNQKKPRLDPNPSFDLCRLGCSIFDMIVDDLKDVSKITSPILKIIINWCMDDKNRNVMYKSNGEERYPDFKLYKMIARTVHNHVPNKVLQNEYFDTYVVEKKKIKSNANMIMDIDSFPSYS